MLILRTLVLDPADGQTIAHAIERDSDEVLQVVARHEYARDRDGRVTKFPLKWANG